MKKIFITYILLFTWLVSLSQTKRDTLTAQFIQLEYLQKRLIAASEELIQFLTQDLEDIRSEEFPSTAEKEKAIRNAQTDLLKAKAENKRLHRYCDSIMTESKRMQDSIRLLESKIPKK